MMKRLVLLTWLLATIINSDLFSQSKEGMRNNFYDAESWILFEAYKDALPLYQQLLQSYPDNSNFKYRIGQCYLNIPGEKARSIRYLEDAVKNIDPNYKEGKFNEPGAPYDALYYLANAYRINNQLDKAIQAYELFKQNLNPAVYDTTVVNLQIQSCRNAKELMKMPVYVRQKNVGNVINGSNSDFNPVVSDNEDLIVFSRNLAFYDAIMYSKKVNGRWSEPVNMNELLKVDRDIFPTSISKDGKDLYLYSSADYDGIIYTSRFQNGAWSPIVKLNDNINTKYWESHATISHDNKKLYFTSNRKGTYGGLDIYVSTRDSSGDWGPAKNLGPVINTPFNEESPFLSEDDKTLFFSSRGHYNMGGYDVFYSNLLPNGEWSTPLNLGYPLNTTDDDLFYKPVNSGFEGYIAKEIPGGFGKQDIYRVEIFTKDHPRKFYARGTAKAAEMISNMANSVKVSAMNLKNPDQLFTAYSNPKTGEYELQVPQGEYKITYESEGSEKVVKKLELSLSNPSDTIIIPGTVLAKSDFIAELVVGTYKTISTSKGDSILFPLKVEPKSLLTVEHWVGDKLISTQHFTITDSAFNYKMAPLNGNNRVIFNLTDRFNNSTKAEVQVLREKNITSQPTSQPEYNRVISQEQIASITNMLKSRANENLSKVVTDVNTENKQFSTVDEYISYLKAEAGKKGVNSDDVDKLALRVALLDNVLTQSAVDYLAKHTDGDLKNILTDLDIYKSNLKTWKDLQTYVEAKSGGKITPEELDRIASGLIAETDPSIALLRNKILAYSENSPNRDLIRKSLTAVDQKNIQSKEKWLQTFYDEAVKQGLTQKQISEMLATISSLPGANVQQYLKDLIEHSEEPLVSALKSIDLEKEGIKTPEDLISYLISHKEKYPEEAVSKSIMDLISGKNISADNIKSHFTGVRTNYLWILWILLGAGLFSLFLILWKRKKKPDK
jgi:hypothetical protein